MTALVKEKENQVWNQMFEWLTTFDKAKIIDDRLLDEDGNWISTYGASTKEKLDSNAIIAWFGYSHRGGGCGGMWDFSCYRYTLFRGDDLDDCNLIFCESSHNDSCNGFEEYEGRWINEDLWDAEKEFKHKSHIYLPDWPDHLQSMNINDNWSREYKYDVSEPDDSNDNDSRDDATDSPEENFITIWNENNGERLNKLYTECKKDDVIRWFGIYLSRDSTLCYYYHATIGGAAMMIKQKWHIVNDEKDPNYLPGEYSNVEIAKDNWESEQLLIKDKYNCALPNWPTEKITQEIKIE